MFKGLRTKIESEQKGQGSINTLQTLPKLTHVSSTERDQGTENPTSNAESHNDSSIKIQTEVAGISQISTASPLDITNLVSANLAGANDTNHKHESDGTAQTIGMLKEEVKRLQEQLKTVIKERDDSNDQNAQLYQLIEKLRRNLEDEKELNSSLKDQLQETEKILRENGQSKDGSARKGRQASSKSFDPSILDESNLAELQSDSIEGLRKHVIDLQGQIIDKNRQLKIRQQNLNDIKRHLQREMADHARTQEELARIQNQLLQATQRQQVIPSESVTSQNGSDHCDSEFNSRNSTSNAVSSDTRQSSTYSDGLQDTRASESAAPHTDNVNDKSSNSESDMNDSHHSSSREINFEYLKNVLFRYMTSTDTETAKHLVKALSVMMDFTPEQKAAIKSAMNVQSSWLRLK